MSSPKTLWVRKLFVGFQTFLRKKLLTKKVTKWVAVYNQNPGGVYPCYTSHIFDTRAEAERDSGCVPRVATTSVEIEVPL